MAWLEYCDRCKRKHLWKRGLCPECGLYEVPRLVSQRIKCWIDGWVDETCDDCVAYREHLRYD